MKSEELIAGALNSTLCAYRNICRGNRGKAIDDIVEASRMLSIYQSRKKASWWRRILRYAMETLYRR